MVTKICTHCNITKEESNFSKCGKGNKTRNCCKECDNSRNRERHAQNKEKYNLTKKEYRATSEKDKIRRIKYKKENKEKINKYHYDRRHQNIEVQLRINFSVRISQYIEKKNKTPYYLGNDLSLAKRWLEYNFKDYYKWNDRKLVWHIDHVMCLDCFDFNDNNDILIAFNWKNIFPLDAARNIKKSNKLIPNLILFQEMKVREFAKKEKLDQLEINNYFKIYASKFKELLAKHLVDREHP